MSGYVECFRGVVYPWHCDHQGHMTVMHYVGMFDQAFWHLISAIGFSRAKLDGLTRVCGREEHHRVQGGAG